MSLIVILNLISSGIWRRVAWRKGINDSGKHVFPLSSVSSATLKMESTRSFETLVPTYQATRCHIIKQRIFTSTRYWNLQCGLGSMYGPLNLCTLPTCVYLPNVNAFKSPFVLGSKRHSNPSVIGRLKRLMCHCLMCWQGRSVHSICQTRIIEGREVQRGGMDVTALSAAFREAWSTSKVKEDFLCRFVGLQQTGPFLCFFHCIPASPMHTAWAMVAFREWVGDGRVREWTSGWTDRGCTDEWLEQFFQPLLKKEAEGV